MPKKINITEEQHQLIYKLRKSGKSYAKIAKEISVSTKFIEKYCKNNNIIYNHHAKRIFRNKEIDKKICKMYKDGYSSIEISRLINLSKPSILNALHENNIDIIYNRSKYSVNKHYFNIINSFEKAYWVGFIAGDGCISRNELIIRLSIKDKDIIERLKLQLKSSHPIKEYTNNQRKYCSLIINSKNIISDLKKYGITERKTKNLNIKNIPENYQNGFILGLIDADGCFRVNKLGNVSLSLISNKKTIDYVQNILIQQCKLNKTKLIQHHSTKEMFYMEYAGNLQMQKIYKYLYTNSTFFMKRKHDRIIQCFKKS